MVLLDHIQALEAEKNVLKKFSLMVENQKSDSKFFVLLSKSFL